MHSQIMAKVDFGSDVMTTVSVPDIFASKTPTED